MKWKLQRNFGRPSKWCPQVSQCIPVHTGKFCSKNHYTHILRYSHVAEGWQTHFTSCSFPIYQNHKTPSLDPLPFSGILSPACGKYSQKAGLKWNRALIKKYFVYFWLCICRYKSPLVPRSVAHTQRGEFDLPNSENNPGFSVYVNRNTLWVFFLSMTLLHRAGISLNEMK